MRSFVQQATQAEHKSETRELPSEVDSNHLYLHVAHT